ncbi:hypothetical protein H4582DRAFT_2111949 [Lactarius indigo]|nr:hypothetical protein H4582DRAFT_2111949 [Lactarius indigo]
MTPAVNEDEAGGKSIVDYHLELDDDWYPYTDRVQFETADLFFCQIQLSASQIDTILCLWSATLVRSVSSLPFHNHTPHGDIPWSSFTLKYNGEILADDIPTWMTATYQICYRDPHVVIHGMLTHPGFKDHMDYVPYCEYDPKTQKWWWQDFMSGNWAWIQADEITKDPSTHGSTFVLIILGSDKTVVSVATGHTEYWPLYLSIGNVCNSLHQAHKGAVTVIGFLSILTAKKKHVASLEFHKFKCKLFHSSITKILQPLHAAMMIPELQVLLACIVRGWCGKCMAFPDNLDTGGPLHSREHLHVLFEETTPGIMWDQYGIADIYGLLAPNILHQLIKGVFKDHLVAWVEQYLEMEHGSMQAQDIMDDIDKRISVIPPFLHLRRFPQGRGFEQWTGDDSKALMKVYLPAIEGHVPSDVVHSFCAFLEICYIARSDVITEQTLLNLEDTLKRFHDYCSIFQTTGVRLDISLPRQHSMMLVTNQHLDKLTAARVNFEAKILPEAKDSDIQGGCCTSDVTLLTDELKVPHLPRLINQFLCEQLDGNSDHEDPNHTCLKYVSRICIFNHATAMFCTPSDPSNEQGMRQEVIQATPLWFKGTLHYDCIFVNSNNELHGMHEMKIAQAICFFSFMYLSVTYPCVLVHWFSHISEEPDKDTGMWMVTPDFVHGDPILTVIHIDCIFRAAHLVPIFGNSFVPDYITHDNSLNNFKGFYVNQFVDYHAFNIACYAT